MKRVFVLGNATLDLVQRVAALPLPGETVLSGGVERCAGGKGLNQAVAAARAGAQTVLIAPVGRDQNGGFLRDGVAREERLEARWLSSPFPTDLSSIWVARDGQNMIVSGASCASWLTSIEALRALDDLIAGDTVVMQGNLSRSTTQEALEFARARGATSILNTAPIAWDIAGLLTGVDIVVANEIEAEQLARQPPGIPDPTCPARAVIVTRGKHGAALTQGGRTVIVPVPEVDVVDTSGAGDVTVGTIAAFLAKGRAIEQALAVAVAAASLSVTRRGTTPSFPSAREIADIAARLAC